MPDRKFTGQNYRFGFNGKENDNDVKGQGNQQDYGMRIYDPRIGKFLSVDPLTKNYQSWTPYAFAMDRPVDGVDLDGMEWNSSTDDEGKTKISVNVKTVIDPDIRSKQLLTNDQIGLLKKTISERFNEILQASNANFSGEITFDNPTTSKQVIPILMIDAAENNPNSKYIIAGSNSREISGANILNRKNEVRPLQEIADIAIHEILHTLRLDHPFEVTQGNDMKLYGILGDDYATSDFLRTGIPTNNRATLFNIMQYGMIGIDRKNLGNLWKQNPNQSPMLSNDQLSFMTNEISLQKQGFGSNIKFDPTGGKTRQKYYYDYWDNKPGTRVLRVESLIKKAFIQ